MNSMTHGMLKQEMSLFDNLHPMIREVMREADCTVYLLNIFQADPTLYELSRERPYEFAMKLKRQLQKWSSEDYINSMAEAKRAAANA